MPNLAFGKGVEWGGWFEQEKEAIKEKERKVRRKWMIRDRAMERVRSMKKFGKTEKRRRKKR